MNSDPRLIEIPDLWHLAERLGLRTPEGKAVLETWHLAHDMKKTLVAISALNLPLLQLVTRKGGGATEIFDRAGGDR
jgi:hypothetical protein